MVPILGVYLQAFEKWARLRVPYPLGKQFRNMIEFRGNPCMNNALFFTSIKMAIQGCKKLGLMQIRIREGLKMWSESSGT